MMQLPPFTVFLCKADIEIALPTAVWPAVNGYDDVALIRRDESIAFRLFAVDLCAEVLNLAVSGYTLLGPIDVGFTMTSFPVRAEVDGAGG